MNRPPRVAVLGNLNYDVTLGISDIPLKKEKSRAKWCFQSAGGAPANVALWLHRLGFSTSLFSVVGEDDFGFLAQSYLKRFGLDCSETVITDRSIDTGLAVVFAHDDHNSMITTGGSYRSAEWEALVNSIQVENFDHVHCHHRYIKVVRQMINDKGLQKTVSLSTDLNGMYDQEIVAASSFTFTNEEELVRALSGKSWLDDASRTIREAEQIMYVTKGGEGSVRIGKDGIIESAAVGAKVVDTTGGGDAYAAGAIAGELFKKEPIRCMELGHLLAAVVVSHPTAQPVVSTVDDTLIEMKKILES